MPAANELIDARFSESVTELQTWIRQPSIAGEGKGMSKMAALVSNRLGEPVMALGPRQIYFGAGSNPLYTCDLETGERRQSTLDDVTRTALTTIRPDHPASSRRQMTHGFQSPLQSLTSN